MTPDSAVSGRQSVVSGQQSDPTHPFEPDSLLAGAPTRLWQERVLLILAGAFILTGLILLALVNSPSNDLLSWVIDHGSLILAFLVWLIVFGGLPVFLNRRIPERDPFILPIVALLTGWGLIEIARLAPDFLGRQVVWLIVSASALILVTSAPSNLRWLRRYRYTWLLFGLILLALTFVIGVNPEGVGLHWWLGGLAGVFFQPSEVIKLLLVVFMASYLAEKREIASSLRLEHRHILKLPYLAPLLTMWGVAVILVLAQQDIGAAILLFLSFLVMLYLASGQARYVAAGLVLMVIALVVSYHFIGKVQGRIDTWLNPWADAAGSSYQIVQSLIAQGSGGLIGSGLGQGYPDVILPAAHTDMPLAAIAEEFGLIGSLGVVACFTSLTLRGLRAATTARTTFGRLLAAGLAASIGLQAWTIMAGNASLIPLTGVTLPFISYGGSSLLISFIAIGLLLQISADRD